MSICSYFVYPLPGLISPSEETNLCKYGQGEPSTRSMYLDKGVLAWFLGIDVPWYMDGQMHGSQHKVRLTAG